MSVDDRHINFKLMREWILAHQDKQATDQTSVGGAATTDVSETAPQGKKYWRSLEELADTP